MTTCVAFVATAISPIMPISSFGIWAALGVFANYVMVMTVSERFLCIPLQNRLFTPESQRQSRGQQYRRGVFDRAGHANPRQAGNAQRARWDIRVGVGQVKN